MNVLVVIDDTLFFLPEFFRGVVRNLPPDHKICATVILRTDPKSQRTLYDEVRKNPRSIGILSIIKMGLLTLKKIFWSKLSRLCPSLESSYLIHACKDLGVPFFVSDRVMKSDTLDWIRAHRPDVILSSCSQIFKNELLQIPRLG
jgi:hypothetical protein